MCTMNIFPEATIMIDKCVVYLHLLAGLAWKISHFSPTVHGRSAQLATHLGLRKVNNLETF